MGWKIIIAPSAQSDLADIVRYIAQHNSVPAARLGYELIPHAENLANFPELGRAVPEFQQPNLREVICRSYRIIYRLRRDEQRIDIVRFWQRRAWFPSYPRRELKKTLRWRAGEGHFPPRAFGFGQEGILAAAAEITQRRNGLTRISRIHAN